ncbi:MAG: response regulator [Bacteroidales bacterium]|nr:response regulator [Bacteroidales bacterium]
MDGFEAIKHIKSFKPDLPVIIQSANSLNDEWEKSKKAGADAYMTKPINPTELIGNLRKFIRPMVTKSA